MSERLTRESFWKLAILLGNAATEGKLKEGSGTFDYVWNAVQSDREAIREETRAEVMVYSLQSLLTRLIRWKDVKSTHATVLVYDEAGTQIQNLGRVPRPKVKRPMTREEKIEKLKEHLSKHLWLPGELKDSSLDDICHAFEITTEVTE